MCFPHSVCRSCAEFREDGIPGGSDATQLRSVRGILVSASLDGGWAGAQNRHSVLGRQPGKAFEVRKLLKRRRQPPLRRAPEGFYEEGLEPTWHDDREDPSLRGLGTCRGSSEDRISMCRTVRPSPRLPRRTCTGPGGRSSRSSSRSWTWRGGPEPSAATISFSATLRLLGRDLDRVEGVDGPGRKSFSGRNNERLTGFRRSRSGKNHAPAILPAAMRKTARRCLRRWCCLALRSSGRWWRRARRSR